jgi:dihydroorotate dehydrogenase
LCSFQLENHVAIGISWLYIEKVNSEILYIVTNFSSPKTTKQTKVHKREKRQKLIADIFPNK